MIGLIDFDGTVVYHVPEGVCPIDTGAEKVLKRLIDCGHKLVLWTCRNHSDNNPYNYVGGKRKVLDSLDEAINWFKERGIQLYGINEVPNNSKYVGTSNKPLCDFVIDDLNVGTPLKVNTVPCILYSGEEKEVRSHCIDWKKMEKLLEKRGIIW